VHVLPEINLEKIQLALAAEKPEIAVIDSIQTLYSDELQSAPGSVAQVRECAAQLTRVAKTTGIAVVFIGHVTKEGALAGPRGGGVRAVPGSPRRARAPARAGLRARPPRPAHGRRQRVPRRLGRGLLHARRRLLTTSSR
jgi:hypothetical protein